MSLKSILSHIGLLEVARVLRSFVKGATPSVLRDEFRLRFRGTPDGVPLPPQQMMFTVISTRWAATFLESGETIVDAMESALQSSGRSLVEFHSILDFGCGCGRLTRQLPKHTNAKIFGCDYNPELVAWCKANLAFGEFTINSLDPPLPYPDSSFDFVFARSIFTHLPEAGQLAWMAELGRVLKPGGILYFTAHGEQFLGQLSTNEIESLKSGNLVVHLAEESGRNICTSYELPGYVEDRLLHGFQLLRYEPGSDQEHLRQDAYLLLK